MTANRSRSWRIALLVVPVLIAAVASGAPFGGHPVVHYAPGSSSPAWKIAPSAMAKPRGIVPHVERGAAPVRNAAPLASPTCPGCTPPLLFHGTGIPVMGGVSSTAGHVTITPVYWAPSGYGYTPTYKSIVDGYMSNVASASRSGTNVFAVATEYYQEASAGTPLQHIQYVVTAGVEIDDATPFPAQGGANCTADPGYTACVDDAALQSELQTDLTTHSLIADDAHLYVVLFPQFVETCEGAGPAGVNNSCSTNVFCGYHAGFNLPSGQPAIYTDMPFPMLNGCADPYSGPQAPNGDSYADAEVSLVSHEANEAITDTFGAWYDSAGLEDGDECAFVYGAAAGSTNAAGDGHNTGTMYNQVIGTGKYYTQDEFSNDEYRVGRGDLTTGTPGATLVPGCVQASSGLLRVTTSPALPSQISVDGNVADTWGLNWLEVGPGSHQVCFSWVQGYTTPACQTVVATSGATTTVTGTFVARGSLRVQTSPAVAGQISVDGTPMDDWGMWTDIPTGQHTVCFAAVKDFTPPACQLVAVAAGTTTQVTGTYAASPGAPALANVGLLRVTTSPALPSQISVDGNVADTWGLNWLEVGSGSHQVCFSWVQGYTTPACQTVAVTGGATTTVTGTFVQSGFLQVRTSPAVAATVFVNGVARDDWGLWTDLPAGTYQVCFGSNYAFVNSPICQTANVSAGSTATLTGNYS
jgi:hypothetical protein